MAAKGSSGTWRLLCFVAIALLACGCATVINPPLNVPLPRGAAMEMSPPSTAMHENSIILSFSGGGLRAAAFAHGALLALESQRTSDGDLLGDVVLISSVSGSSLTAAYYGLHGRKGLASFRDKVLIPGFERDLSLTLNPVSLYHLLGAGLNSGGELGRVLDRDAFHGATFADLYRKSTVDVRIHATELYYRMPFPFIPAAFKTLCSDINRYPVAQAVAASMAVPMVFSPVVLRSYPGHCVAPPAGSGSIPNARVSHTLATISQAIKSYQEPPVKYAKLADGGLIDNFAVNEITLSRLFVGTPTAPMSERDAVRIRRLLFVTVDASRPSRGEWLEKEEGPEGISLALAGMDAAIDSAARFAADAFDRMVADWQRSIIDFRCGLSAEQVKNLGGPADFDCRAVSFSVAHLSVNDLPPPIADRIASIPTRLALEPAQIDDAIEGGRLGMLGLPELHAYLDARTLPDRRSARP